MATAYPCPESGLCVPTPAHVGKLQDLVQTASNTMLLFLAFGSLWAKVSLFHFSSQFGGQTAASLLFQLLLSLASEAAKHISLP